MWTICHMKITTVTELSFLLNKNDSKIIEFAWVISLKRSLSKNSFFFFKLLHFRGVSSFEAVIEFGLLCSPSHETVLKGTWIWTKSFQGLVCAVTKFSGLSMSCLRCSSFQISDILSINKHLLKLCKTSFYSCISRLHCIWK